MSIREAEEKAVYTCYRFYRIGTRNGPYEQPLLYAFTFDKKLAKLFEAYRDMNFFICDKVQMSYREHLEFRDHFKAKNIVVGTFLTKNGNGISLRPQEITIPCTWKEEEAVCLSSEKVFYELGKRIRFLDMVHLFGGKYKDLIDILMIPKVYLFYQAQFELPKVFPEEVLFGGRDTLSIATEIDMRVDELGLFVYFFGDTLNDKVIPIPDEDRG